MCCYLQHTCPVELVIISLSQCHGIVGGDLNILIPSTGLSLILADRQRWKCWGVQLQPRGCPAGATEVAGGDPCPTPLHLPREVGVPSGCSALSSPTPPWPSRPWRAPEHPEDTGSVVRRCPDLTHPGIEGRDRGSHRNCGQGFLLLSSLSAPGEAGPFPAWGSHLEPPPHPSQQLMALQPSQAWAFPLAVAFWQLP